MESNYVQVTIDSIRISLVSPHRVVVLKDAVERFLPIWIGPFEADAINIALQGNQVARPLTHDLLKAVLHELGAEVSKIVINDLREDTFFAQIVMDVGSRHVELDSRSSDAIALAVRMGVPIFVHEPVMARAAIRPTEAVAAPTTPASPEEEERLDAFRDLFEDLDLDGLGKGDSPKED